ncbi:MAG: FCD domain-containing protein [Mycobacterium sp.]
MTRTGQPAKSLRDHKAILAAIRAGNPAKAADQMLRHLVGTTDGLLKGERHPESG